MRPALFLDCPAPDGLSGATWGFVLLDSVLTVDSFTSWTKSGKRAKPSPQASWHRVLPRRGTLDVSQVPYTDEIGARAKALLLEQLAADITVGFQGFHVRQPTAVTDEPGPAQNPLKVFGGLSHFQGRQVRTKVAAKSKAEAARLLGVAPSSFGNWWAETSNSVEQQAALAAPGVVLHSSSVHTRDFRTLT